MQVQLSDLPQVTTAAPIVQGACGLRNVKAVRRLPAYSVTYPARDTSN
jgi:hypothetical protein